jgi:hypothetical protein
VHQCKGASARLSQHTSLSNPILKKRQLHCLRSISPEVIGNRIGMILGSYNMRIHAPGFGGTVEARVYEKRPKDQNLRIHINPQRKKKTYDSH